MAGRLLILKISGRPLDMKKLEIAMLIIAVLSLIVEALTLFNQLIW